MAEATLQFENARAVQTLYGNRLDNLTLLENTLDLKVTSRDGWVKLKGRSSQLKLAKQLFEHLHTAHGKGIRLHSHEFRYALEQIAAGDGVELSALYNDKVFLSSKRPPIVPKTFGQKTYVDLIRERDVTFGVGPAGTGKTYLAVALAVTALKNNLVNKIILTRPAVEAGESLGFLPGDLQEKLLPYLRPLYDALQDMMDVEEVERLREKGVLEIAPLAYMRGRTLTGSFVILDEAQNTTTEQMFMFLTRLGQGSKCVVTGDSTQIDLPNHRKSGLVEALQALPDTEGVGIHVFQEKDVVRHEIVGRIITAYRNHRGIKQTSLSL
jgi:phosphate starvation-inducible PhoH-like protein